MRILIIAIEAGRWGPSRLPQALRTGGHEVAALCPAGNALAATDHNEKLFLLPATRSGRRLTRAVAQAIAAWQPELIVPADEQVVALLQTLVRRGGRRSGLSADDLAMVVGSLGPAEQFDAMLLKSHTLALARRLGVRVPDGGTVTGRDQAAALAAEIGYPVFLKASFGWAGAGVTRCTDAGELAAALPGAPGRLARVKSVLRRWLHRDWYPANTPCDIQQAIAGTPAMYCVLAWQGQMLAGFAGIPQRTSGATGPSTAVWLGPHAEMAQAAAAMVQGLGATGFLGFDFMLERGSGQAYLLECNPRPIQVCHLGGLVGVDLAAALARGPAAGAVETATRECLVTLFPQAWQADPAATPVPGSLVDQPSNDAGLLRCMQAACGGTLPQALTSQFATSESVAKRNAPPLPFCSTALVANP